MKSSRIIEYVTSSYNMCCVHRLSAILHGTNDVMNIMGMQDALPAKNKVVEYHVCAPYLLRLKLDPNFAPEIVVHTLLSVVWFC